MSEEKVQESVEDEGVSAPKEDEGVSASENEEDQGVSASEPEDTGEEDTQEASSESSDATFEEEFGDSIERLFKKCLWEVIPDEYFQEDRNRPKPEYRDAYYNAVEAEVSELVNIFKSRSETVIERLENAEVAVVIKAKVEEALASGDLALITKLAEQVEAHNTEQNPADIY